MRAARRYADAAITALKGAAVADDGELLSRCATCGRALIADQRDKP